MATVYVREQGATVRKTGEQLRVTQRNRELFTIPLANLEQLILLGNVQITTPAAALLMRIGCGRCLHEQLWHLPWADGQAGVKICPTTTPTTPTVR